MTTLKLCKRIDRQMHNDPDNCASVVRRLQQVREAQRPRSRIDIVSAE
jgi:hypothetical protein